MLGLFPQYEDFYKLFRKRPGNVWEICANFNYCNDKLFFKMHFPLLWKSGGRFQTYFSKSILKPKCYVISLKQTKKY